MSEFCHHFPSSPWYSVWRTMPPLVLVVTDVEPDSGWRLCACMNNGKSSSSASTREDLIFIAGLLFANWGISSRQGLDHLLDQQRGRFQRQRPVDLNHTLHFHEQVLVGIDVNR